MCCYIRNKNSDCSKSDHTKFLSFDFCSGKTVFFFQQSFKISPSSFISCTQLIPPMISRDARSIPAITSSFYTIRICSRCIEYNNSFLCTFIKRNIIHSGSRTSDCLQVLCQIPSHAFLHCLRESSAPSVSMSLYNRLKKFIIQRIDLSNDI